MQDRETLLQSIRDGMEVVDKIGTRIGTVARVEGGHVKIDRPEQEPLNDQQFVSPDSIESVTDRVVLNRSWDELRRIWAKATASRTGSTTSRRSEDSKDKRRNPSAAADTGRA